jgi:Helix-turn-helix domain
MPLNFRRSRRIFAGKGVLRIQHFIATDGGWMELTTSQAVQAYGVFPNVLHRMILMGRLEARKDENGRWLISKESLEHWNRQRVRRAPKPERS